MAKVAASDNFPPRVMDSEELNENDEDSNSGIRMRKQLGLLDGVAIIVGVIIGSGIFVSPKVALKYSGSIGMALILWILSGMFSMIGALCYAELGTMIPKSGGDYAYISEAFGPLPAFLYLWVALFILVPTGNAITAITFAQNILAPLWPSCFAPYGAVRLIAAAVTCFLTAINCFNVKWVTRVQDTFTLAKVLALIVIFCASVWHLFDGHTENLQAPFEGTTTSPGNIAVAIYSGLFSYSGWNYLNFVTEELKDPFRNLPRAICISMPVVTLVYAVTNFAFFAVLTRNEILTSEAVAVTFSEKILGVMSWTMPVFVALCTLGSLNGAIFTSSRLFFVGARNGHLPLAISLIDIKRLTPVPSLIFMCLITLVLLTIDEVDSLIVFVTFVEALFILMSVSGLLWLRRSRPDLTRPIKVNLILPFVFFAVCVFLVIFPCLVYPYSVGIGVLFICLGIPVYYVTIEWRNKPRSLNNFYESFNKVIAKMFMCVPEDCKDL